MKKVNTYILGSLLLWQMGCTLSYAAISRNVLTDTIQKIIPTASPGSKNISYVSIAQEVQYWIFALVGIIAVIYIVWVGAKLLWAPGNTEEVTTAMKSLGYIVIGLALIPFAYFVVTFITHFTL